MTAYGYIRKSVVHDAARMLSPDMQDAEIRRLADYHHDSDLVLLSDLDVSGKKDRAQRPGWDELLRAVETGEAHAVYSYSLSRLSRRVKTLAEFFDLCAEKSVPIRLAKDEISTNSATGKFSAHILAAVAQLESDVTTERVLDAFAAKRAKDPAWDGPGQPPYGRRPGEDVEVILGAFRERGSYDGAAKLLNEMGVPCRVRGAAWSGTVVSAIVRREAPDEVRHDLVFRGAPAGKRSFRFSGLVRCSTCEAKGIRVGSKASTFLTGSWDKRRGEVRYACSRARTVPHARGWVNEAKLLPVIVAEAQRAVAAARRLQKGSAEDEAALAALATRRRRVLDNYEDSLIDRAERDTKLAAIATEESKLSAVRWIKRIPVAPDIEHDDPGAVNAYLRRLFTHVEVDMSEKAYRGPSKWVPTVEFEWRDQDMRAAVADDTYDGLHPVEALA